MDSLAALIRNALEATPVSDRVDVALGADEDGVCIRIQDRGEGIPADILPRIGTPFFTTKGGDRGLGLGVFLARTFFESRGGWLSLESKPGIGTCATVHLPLTGAA